MTNYNEKLWDEIPGYAFMALGRRGREQISLFQCFVPSCNCAVESKLHPIEKKVESEVFPEKNYKLEKVKYLIHCDECNKNFHLVFEKHNDLNKSNKDNPDEAVFMERVYATDESDSEDYGEIGHIQGR